MKVDFFRHSIDDSDINRVTDILKSIFLTTGAAVSEFECKLAVYLNMPHVIGVTSCTAALQLSLLAWEIGAGDEVITTPMTFCATSNAIMHVGARPVFVDVEKSTGNMDARLIEARITDRTRAIMPVHLYGQMCDMVEIRRIADHYGLVVIEDAAHCLEGERDGVRVGQLADAACFSFYATKNITSGEGGAIVVHDQEKAETITKLRLHGIDKSAADRYEKKFKHWDMTVLGWKYNMDNIQAALLIGQLARIEDLWPLREKVAQKYRRAFENAPNIDLPADLPDSRHARHLYTIQVPAEKRDDLLLSLPEKGVGVAVNYRAVHLLNYYQKRFGYQRGMYPLAENIGDRTLSLPLYPKITDAEVDYVIETVLEETSGF